MATNYMAKNKCCTSDSSTGPSSPSSITALSYVNNVPNTNGSTTGMQNGLMLSNGNTTVAQQTIVNGQNSSESPSPGINNNNAPKFGTPVPNRIFVGGISAQTTESELAQLFSSFGTVKGTKIIVDRAGVSKGYGFVTFETEMEAQRIMREAQSIMFKQRKLNIAPAIKKQSFSRSLEIQSPPIGIPSTVMYANGSPYMFHNGMAFFSPPEPTSNFQAAPSNQIPAVPGAATVCPSMMYPCPPGQPLYQYPYQPVPNGMLGTGDVPMLPTVPYTLPTLPGLWSPAGGKSTGSASKVFPQGHIYRSGQAMQYYLTPQPPPPPPPPVVSTENSGYCAYEGQYMQYCDSIQASDVPVPQMVSNPVYLSTVKAPASTNPNPVYHPATSSKPAKTKDKPHKKRNKMTYCSNNSSPAEETCFVDEGGSGDATGSHQTAGQIDYCQNYSETEDNYNPNTVYYVVPNSDPVQANYLQSNYTIIDNNYVLDPSQTQSLYYGNPQNPGPAVGMKIPNQQQVYPKNNALYYPVPQNAFGTVIGQNPPYPTPSYGACVHQNAAAAAAAATATAMYLNGPFGNVPNSSYFLSVDNNNNNSNNISNNNNGGGSSSSGGGNNYGTQGEQKDSACWNRGMVPAEEKRSRNGKTNVKVKNVTPCKHKTTTTKEVTKDMKNLKL